MSIPQTAIDAALEEAKQLGIELKSFIIETIASRSEEASRPWRKADVEIIANNILDLSRDHVFFSLGNNEFRVCSVRHIDDTTATVSNAYPDGKWRVTHDPRRGHINAPGDFSFSTRVQAAQEAQKLALLDWISIAKEAKKDTLFEPEKSVSTVDLIAAQAMLACLEGIRATHPELIADNAPKGWGMNHFRNAIKAATPSSQSPDDQTITIDLNIFDDECNVVDGTTSTVSLSQASEIIDHSSQIILMRRSGNNFETFLDDLETTLSNAGVIEEANNAAERPKSS